MPRNTASAGMRSASFTTTAAMRPSFRSTPVTCVSNRTVPPHRMISARRFFTTVRRMSVPMCGFWSTRISSGAPAAINASMMARIRGSLLRAVSFPSENVPAPPSPNCTLDSGSSRPVFQNTATSCVRRSTSRPRSRTIGAAPACASTHAAKIPAGPNPTTTGRCTLRAVKMPGGKSSIGFSSRAGAISLSFLCFRRTARSSSTCTSSI